MKMNLMTTSMLDSEDRVHVEKSKCSYHFPLLVKAMFCLCLFASVCLSAISTFGVEDSLLIPCFYFRII